MILMMRGAETRKLLAEKLRSVDAISLTSPGEVSGIDDDGVGLRWVVEYICYGYF